MKKVKVEIEGILPLLMHSPRLANPLDSAARAYKEVSGKRKKTDEDYQWMAENEWLLGLYLNEDDEVIIPDLNIEACLIEAAKSMRKGTDFKTAVIVNGAARLRNPETGRYYKLDAIREDADFYDTRPVKLKRSDTIMRTRPIFKQWGCEFEIMFDDTIVNKSDVISALNTAGRIKGLGDYRPRFGKFEVKNVN
jgi:hypothetical protein